MSLSISTLLRRIAPIFALGALVLAMGGTWATAEPTAKPARAAAAVASGGTADPAANSARASRASRPSSAAAASSAASEPASSASAADEPAEDAPSGKRRGARSSRKELTGKLNLNTATEEQLMLLPTVGPSKAERIVTWRKKNGGFKRTADLRRVKGFGYKTFKRLEPYLDITGETTLAVKN
ncbi:MAG TPA: helix-hairpin-helix domain-containing protein [Kofleriaceae bacterium]|nr:helix-hairpin-helix domain-containing protein [Kofleriaceae bacterium]